MTKKYLICKLDDEYYGINMSNVCQILATPETEITKISDCKEEIVNIWGNIPFIDLRKKLSLPEVKTTKSSRLIILGALDKTVAVLVDEISEVLVVNKNEIKHVPGFTPIDKHFIKGTIIKGEKTIFLIIPETLIDGKNININNISNRV
jgi:chemotaxis signal transduction protein